MKDLYEKMCLIIGEILCYSNKIAWASAPIYGKDEVIIKFMDMNSHVIEVKIPHTSIVKVHDHSLESLIFGLFLIKSSLTSLNLLSTAISSYIVPCINLPNLVCDLISLNS